MNLYLQEYIEKMLKKARIEYDPEVKCWVGILKELPGVYAQKSTQEETEQELMEVIEEWIYLSLQENTHIPGFKFPAWTEYKHQLQLN